jgi:hypothetical protein
MPGCCPKGLRDVRLQAGRTKSPTVYFTRSKVPAHRWGQEPANRKAAPATQVINLANHLRLQIGIDVEETEDQPAPAEVTAARVGHWLDERVDLARVYAELWKDAAPVHLVDVAVFCDSDDTHTAKVSYFAYVPLERR